MLLRSHKIVPTKSWVYLNFFCMLTEGWKGSGFIQIITDPDRSGSLPVTYGSETLTVTVEFPDLNARLLCYFVRSTVLTFSIVRRAGGERPGLGSDWRCVRCNCHNPGRRYTCQSCRLRAPDTGASTRTDWRCPGCDFHNLRFLYECKSCGRMKPGIDKLLQDESGPI